MATLINDPLEAIHRKYIMNIRMFTLQIAPQAVTSVSLILNPCINKRRNIGAPVFRTVIDIHNTFGRDIYAYLDSK